MKTIIESKVIEKIGDCPSLIYIAFEMPMLLNNRDLVLSIKKESGDNRLLYLFESTTHPDFPEK